MEGTRLRLLKNAGSRRYLRNLPGNVDIITVEHMKLMKDQAIVVTSATSITRSRWSR
jgi:S-adenosylhomocysteine hydrolase